MRPARSLSTSSRPRWSPRNHAVTIMVQPSARLCHVWAGPSQRQYADFLSPTCSNPPDRRTEARLVSAAASALRHRLPRVQAGGRHPGRCSHPARPGHQPILGGRDATPPTLHLRRRPYFGEEVTSSSASWVAHPNPAAMRRSVHRGRWWCRRAVMRSRH